MLVTSDPAVAAALARGRAAHLRLMTDVAQIRRQTGSTFDPVNGVTVPTWTVVYEGVADVRPRDLSASGVESGQTTTVRSVYDCVIPFDADTTVLIEDQVTATATADPRLLGRPMRVIAVGLGSRRTGWHITCEDVEQP